MTSTDRQGITKPRTDVVDPMTNTRIRLYLFCEQITSSRWGAWEPWREEYQHDAYGVEQLIYRDSDRSYATEGEALQAQERLRRVVGSARALG